MRIFTLIILATLLFSGCSEKAPTKGTTLVEEFAGVNAIKQGQAAKTKIDEINKAAKERNAEF